MVAHPDLSADHTIVLDHRTAGYACLSRYHHPLTDSYVVGDLDQIIDLSTFTDPRFTESSPIN